MSYVIRLSNGKLFSEIYAFGTDSLEGAWIFDTEAGARFVQKNDFPNGEVVSVKDLKGDLHGEITVRQYSAAAFRIDVNERQSRTAYFKDRVLGEVETHGKGWYGSNGSFYQYEPMLEVTVGDGTVLHFPISSAVHVQVESTVDIEARKQKILEGALAKLTLEEKIELGLLQKK